MELTDATLIALSSVLIAGSSALIIYVNLYRCRRPQAQVETVQTIVAWK